VDIRLLRLVNEIKIGASRTEEGGESSDVSHSCHVKKHRKETPPKQLLQHQRYTSAGPALLLHSPSLWRNRCREWLRFDSRVGCASSQETAVLWAWAPSPWASFGESLLLGALSPSRHPQLQAGRPRIFNSYVGLSRKINPTHNPNSSLETC